MKRKAASKSSWVAGLLVSAAAMVIGVSPAAAAEPFVSVVSDGQLGPAASHGLAKLTTALGTKGIVWEQVDSLAECAARSLSLLAWRGVMGPRPAC